MREKNSHIDKKKHKVKKWATEKLNGIKKGRTRATEITTTSTPTTIIKTKIWIKIDSINDVGTRHLAKKPEFLEKGVYIAIECFLF